MKSKKAFKKSLALTISSVAILASTAVLLSLPMPTAKTFTPKLQNGIAPLQTTTTITLRDDYLDTTYVHKFMQSVKPFGVVNQNEIFKYVKIDGLPNGTTIDVTQKRIDYDTGIISITVELDRSYDANGKLDFSKPFVSPILELHLVPRPKITQISAKTSYPTTERVDTIISSFAESATGGAITNEENLAKYVDIIGLPDNAVLSIDTEPTVGLLEGTVDFVLSSTSFYGNDYELNNNGDTYNISLKGFVPKYNSTTITAKSTYDKSMSVDAFFTKIVTNGQTDLTMLSEYVDLVSIPPAAKVKALLRTLNNKTGLINFDVQLSEYYNADNNLVKTAFLFPIELELSPVLFKTTVTPLTSYPETINNAWLVTNLGEGATFNQNVLEKFISIKNIPNGASVTAVTYNPTDKKDTVSMTIEIDQYYDENLDLLENGIFNVDLPYRSNGIRTEPTPLATIPNDVSVDAFIDLVYPNNAIDYPQLTRYVDLSTFPPEANLTIPSDYSFDGKTGEIWFKIRATNYYDDSGTFVSALTNFDLKLKLLPTIKRETKITSKRSYSIMSYDEFVEYTTINGKINYNRLNEFLDLSLVPNTANISIENVQREELGKTTFNVVTDKFFQEDSLTKDKYDLIEGKYVEYDIVLDLLPSTPSLNWLWITLGSVAGIAIIVTLVYYLQKNKDKKIFLF